MFLVMVNDHVWWYKTLSQKKQDSFTLASGLVFYVRLLVISHSQIV